MNCTTYVPVAQVICDFVFAYSKNQVFSRRISNYIDDELATSLC